MIKADGIDANTRIILEEENKNNKCRVNLPITSLGGSGTQIAWQCSSEPKHTIFWGVNPWTTKTLWETIYSAVFIKKMFLDLGLLIVGDPKWETVVPGGKKL